MRFDDEDGSNWRREAKLDRSFEQEPRPALRTVRRPRLWAATSAIDTLNQPLPDTERAA